jgi:hypothetical protein
VGDAVARGQLAVMPAADSYLSELPFDPERMVSSLHALDDALADGYRGLSVAGEMSWAAPGVRGAERLEEYDERAGRCSRHARPRRCASTIGALSTLRGWAPSGVCMATSPASRS